MHILVLKCTRIICYFLLQIEKIKEHKKVIQMTELY